MHLNVDLSSGQTPGIGRTASVVAQVTAPMTGVGKGTHEMSATRLITVRPLPGLFETAVRVSMREHNVNTYIPPLLTHRPATADFERHSGGDTPVGSTPEGDTPVGNTRVGSTPVGVTPIGVTKRRHSLAALP